MMLPNVRVDRFAKWTAHIGKLLSNTLWRRRVKQKTKTILDAPDSQELANAWVGQLSSQIFQEFSDEDFTPNHTQNPYMMQESLPSFRPAEICAAGFRDVGC